MNTNGTNLHKVYPKSQRSSRICNNCVSIKEIKLWTSPFKTLYGFWAECLFRCTQLLFAMFRYKIFFVCLSFICSIFIIFDFKDGFHQEGPFIAQITMGAYECLSTNFPEPPFPDKIICPENDLKEDINMWKIIQKVQVPSILWGLGTALGELPPYFMARGVRLSGEIDEENDELEEFADILATALHHSNDKALHNNLVYKQKQRNKNKSLSLTKRAELFLHRLVMRAGFFGILLCASVPNPLFDLAGMTCGHFLVPFWSFFGATFIGKALIKVHIQQLTVIAISSEHHVERLVDLIGLIPVYGKKLEEPFLNFVKQQREKMHSKITDESGSFIKIGIQFIVLGMIIMFIISIINASAQNYYRRLNKWKREGNLEITGKDE